MSTRNSIKNIWVLLFLVFGIAFVSANGNSEQSYYGCHGYGSNSNFGHMQGYGPMGGYGHMGGNFDSTQNDYSERLSSHSITENVESYVTTYFGSEFYIEEIMEFDRNFYAQIGKKGDNYLAAELLIDPYTGRVFPEMGPNMMWNQSYGHMRSRFWQEAEIKISAEESVQRAQEYLDASGSGFKADDHVAIFNGYYTLHTMKDGAITGMLSVNAFNGEVWYHNWHGRYIGSSTNSHSD